MKLASIVALPFAVLLFSCAEPSPSPPSKPPAYEAGPTGPALSCLPNQDGVIEARELQPRFDVDESLIVQPTLPSDAKQGYAVDVRGSVSDKGKTVWDWTAKQPSERSLTVRAHTLGDQWYAANFPGGQFSLAVDLAGALDAVYSQTEGALRLHGVASANEHPDDGQTLLVYKTPIDFFPFPLTVGKSWTAVGTVENGTLKGVNPWSQDDSYEFEVDGAGELRVPGLTFSQALRVRTKVTVHPKVGSTNGYSQRQTIFVYECFGEVARATSLFFKTPEEDPGKDFTEASETRKFGAF